MERLLVLDVDISNKGVVLSGDSAFYIGDNNKIKININNSDNYIVVVNALIPGGTVISNKAEKQPDGSYLLDNIDAFLMKVGTVKAQLAVSLNNEKITINDFEFTSLLTFSQSNQAVTPDVVSLNEFYAALHVLEGIDLHKINDAIETIDKLDIAQLKEIQKLAADLKTLLGTAGTQSAELNRLIDTVNQKLANGDFNGADGAPGADGVSPTVSIAETAEGHEITITDVSGPHKTVVKDGKDGMPGPAGKDGTQGPAGRDGADGTQGPAGKDGFSPTVKIQPIAGGYTLTITDSLGEHTANIMNGKDGAGNGEGGSGVDGFSPIVSLDPIDGGYTLTITDKTGPHTATIKNGKDGVTGPQGAPGKNGTDGLPGPKGDTGPVGPTGKDGAPGAKGDKGEPGTPGKDGAAGANGKDGVSPVVSIEPAADGFTINIKDASGTHTATIKNGKDGADGLPGAKGEQGIPGKDGVNGKPGPVGPAGKDGTPGAKGDPGVDGVSPTVSIVPSDNGYTLTITDKEGAHTANILNGKDGAPGIQGPAGPQGLKGNDGKQGPQGLQGPAGKDGAAGAKGDKGDTGAPGKDGAAGAKGADGFSPSVEIIPNSMDAEDFNGTKIIITDAAGPHEFFMRDALDGINGFDGKGWQYRGEYDPQTVYNPYLDPCFDTITFQGSLCLITKNAYKHGAQGLNTEHLQVICKKGDSYVLTPADKAEIVSSVSSEFTQPILKMLE